MDPEISSLGSAVQDFYRARNQADLKVMLARFTGQTTQLLSFDEVRQKLGLQGSTERGIKDIPLDSIVGSVGRYTDFTRDFLPRRDINPQRWARVKIAASGLVGLPPIEVYQIGDAYFVEDGNHRVSVARQLGATHIQAYVYEVHSRVPLTPDVKADDLIMIAEYSHFLEKTHLDEVRPEADLRVTVPGQYQVILEHIDVHRYYMGLDFKRDIPYAEAVTHWYDAVYLPIAKIIREQAVLHRFPGRTETDLYLWIAQQRAAIEEQLGWKIQPEHAASDLIEALSAEKQSVISRIGERLMKLIVPEKLEGGPPVGAWRGLTSASRTCDCLFLDILVPINGREDGWCALEQAIQVTKQEQSQLLGLYVVKTDARKSSPAALKVKAEFEQRCQQADIQGQLVVAVNEKIADEIIQRAGYADLVVTTLAHPPANRPLARLNSGFRDLILRCPRPILAVPQTVTKMERALLAYDGSPKAKEALYLAAYLAGKWKIPIVALTVGDEGQKPQATLKEAQEYLETHSAPVTAILENGPIAETILKVSQAQECDLLIIGGYGQPPVLEVALGSVVDQVLRQSRIPILFCR